MTVLFSYFIFPCLHLLFLPSPLHQSYSSPLLSFPLSLFQSKQSKFSSGCSTQMAPNGPKISPLLPRAFNTVTRDERIKRLESELSDKGNAHQEKNLKALIQMYKPGFRVFRIRRSLSWTGPILIRWPRPL